MFRTANPPSWSLPLAKWAFEQVEPHIQTTYGNQLRLVAMHVRETPKSWASWTPELSSIQK